MESQPKNPPRYPPDNDEVHNHFYQIQADDQRPIAWYRKKKCFLVTIALAILAIILVVVGIVVIVVLTKKANRDYQDDTVQTPVRTISVTPEILTSESSTAEIWTSLAPSLTPSILTSMVVTSSIVTVTFTHSEESEAVETTVLTVTATKSEEQEDLGEILSSMLSPIPFFTTEVVTISHTVENDNTSTTSTSTVESSSSTTSNTSSPPSQSSSIPSAVTTDPISPSLSNNSRIAAVDVNIGPSNLHRRLVMWQDQDQNIIARDSTSSSDQISVYRLEAGTDILKPQSGTHFAAASDDKGAIHIFYLSDSDDKKVAVVHLIQKGAGEWESREQQLYVTQGSSLSATWHHNGNSTPTVLLAYQSPENKICLYLVDDGQSLGNKGTVIDVTELLDLSIEDWDPMGMSVASGIRLVSKSDEKGGKAGDYAGVYFLLEGSEEVLVAECSINPGSKDDPPRCFWLSAAFTNSSGDPIEIRSHPTQLSWTLRRPASGAPPIIYGFLALDDEGSTINEHRIVPRDDSESSVATTTSGGEEPHSTLETYSVEEADIEAMAMTDERTLLVRAGTRLFEFSFAENGWQDRKEIDTTL